MPPNKRRKVNATTTGRPFSVLAKQKGIQAFGKVIKAATTVQYAVKKEYDESELAAAQYAEERPAESTNSKKRKLITVDKIELQDQSCSDASPSVPCSSPGLIGWSSLPSDRGSPAPKAPSLKVLGLPSTDTPTKGARGCLEILNLASSPLSTKQIVLSNKVSTSTLSPRSSAKENSCTDRSSTELPNELLDLIDLTSSFLTALSLHYAHHGSWTPADLRLLTPSIERSWGKRKVTTENIRIILGIMRSGFSVSEDKGSTARPTSTLKLSDYGHGKLCIEISGASANRGFMARPLDEKALNATFLRNLTASYGSWRNKHTKGTSNIEDFTSALPLAPLHTCSSLQTLSPILVKGQRRLTDLKAGAILTKKDVLNFHAPSRQTLSTSTSTADKDTTTTSNPPTPPSTQTRKSSLLDRIRAKELHQSTLPPPPSRDSLDRQAALQRLEEVVPVLHILTTSTTTSSLCTATEGRKLSFTLPTLVQTLQNSLRNPISKAEAELCVVLLAEEVAPEWVRLVRCGKVVGVVVSAGVGVGMGEVRGRVRGLLG